MTDKIKTAVIGVGHLGQAHARVHASLEQAELVAVCDIDESHGSAIAERHATRYVRDYRELLDQVEAVSVATPTVSHHEIAAPSWKRASTFWSKNRSRARSTKPTR